jgi:holo-[acyl-carrier protein] synthase
MVHLPRFEATLDRTPTFVRDVFTEAETAECELRDRPHVHLAARFAGKEAIYKALAPEQQAHVSWQNIEIVSDANGGPTARFVNLTDAAAARLRGIRISVSLTHESEYAQAVALVEDRQGE